MCIRLCLDELLTSDEVALDRSLVAVLIYVVDYSLVEKFTQFRKPKYAKANFDVNRDILTLTDLLIDMGSEQAFQCVKEMGLPNGNIMGRDNRWLIRIWITFLYASVITALSASSAQSIISKVRKSVVHHLVCESHFFMVIIYL